MKKLFTILALLLLFAGHAYSQSLTITCSQNNCYVVNPNAGKLILGTNGEYDLQICTNQGGDDTECMTFDDSVPALVPDTDDNIDLGTASAEFQDAFFDGTVTADGLANSGDSTLGGLVVKSTGALESDATNLGLDAAAGSNTACDTTCAVADGACVFGFDAGTTALVDCASALADTCICAESVS